MDAGARQFILQIAALVIGGGFVQLVIYLLKRRTEIRSIDSESDSKLLLSANTYIETLHADLKMLRDELASCKKEIAEVRNELRAEQRSSARALANSERELNETTAEVGRIRADLAVARAQIRKLSEG